MFIAALVNIHKKLVTTQMSINEQMTNKMQYIPIMEYYSKKEQITNICCNRNDSQKVMLSDSRLHTV